MGHHHTARQIIDDALFARGLSPLPQPWICPCCHDALDPDDRADAEAWTTAGELIERYGEMPCHSCADEHVPCAYCERIMPPSKAWAWTDDDGPLCSAACERDWWREVG